MTTYVVTLAWDPQDSIQVAERMPALRAIVARFGGRIVQLRVAQGRDVTLVAESPEDLICPDFLGSAADSVRASFVRVDLVARGETPPRGRPRRLAA